MALRKRTALVACLGVALLFEFSGASADDWTTIGNPSELRNLFSNKTFRKHHLYHKSVEGWIAHFREDGEGIYKTLTTMANNTVVIGRPLPRTWKLKGEDQVCISSLDTGAVNCYRFQRNRNHPNELTMINVSNDYAESIVVEDGIPKF